MESRQETDPVSKVPIIFGLINSYQLHEILEKNGAKIKESRAVFLIRDSSSYPGLAAIFYYSQEQEIVKSVKFGLTADGWKLAPKKPQEPQMTDTLDIKDKYTHDKAKFDEFINTAKMLFEQTVTSEQIETLRLELQKNEFDINGLIKPNRQQATHEKHFTDYVSDAFITNEDLNPANSSKYMEW
ncbi:MAG: hypothetical protein ACRCXC_10820 [Legionella sp.]